MELPSLKPSGNLQSPYMYSRSRTGTKAAVEAAGGAFVPFPWGLGALCDAAGLRARRPAMTHLGEQLEGFKTLFFCVWPALSAAL